MTRPFRSPATRPATDRLPARHQPSVAGRNAQSAFEPKGAYLPAMPAAQLFTVESLARAWLAVKRNGGGAGVDGLTLEQFDRQQAQELAELHALLVSGRYRPRPVRQIMVPKASGGLRPLALWALRDRVAQRALYDLLAPLFEGIFLSCNVGFRSGQGVPDAVGQLLAQRDQDRRWVVNADIKDCFDTINPNRLMTLIAQRVHDPLLQRYVRGWLQARILNSADGVPRRAGTSQGNVLSPLLANIYLHEVDQHLVRQGLAYIRYADNFVVCCRRKADATSALEQCRTALAAWDLRLNDQKTAVVHFDQGFSWLGHFFVRRQVYRL
jgi:group II intron reverse transcriptase/maturase